MIRQRIVRTALAATLVATLPSAVVAQEPAPTEPEGTSWTLTGYFDAEVGELVPVPFGVEPSLLLDGGVASGSGGCNDFSGNYELDGGSLRFDPEMTVTLALCDEAVQQVEDAYLATLPEVDGWMLDAGMLELSDDFGDVLLTFEVPHILWTTSQMDALMTTIEELQTGMAELDAGLADLGLSVDTLRADMEALNVPKLRERIKALEAENEQILKRLDALETAPKPQATSKPTQPTSFNAAEKTLLKGIPSRIANYCQPLRSSLPKATKAAVSCQPNTKVVTNVNYYLLEGSSAAQAFGTAMDTYNVPDAVAADQTCEQGVKSQRQWLGNGWQADGCYRYNQRAELRFVDNATDCKKLKVGDKTMAAPAFLIALQGTDGNVANVYQWATKDKPAGSTQLTGITQPIPSDLGPSTSCPA